MYPRTIDDGHGSRITFLGVDDDRLLMAGTVDPGAGPPEHVHHLQTETVTVVSGRVAAVVAGEQRVAGPGETLVFAPGVPHRFWNAGDTVAEVTGTASPPGNLEWYLTQIYNAGGRPGTLDGAFLATRYGSEFTITEIPTAVRRLLLPALAACARVLRRYPHFADAPAPARPHTGATLTGRSTTRARSSAG
jgi:mannose-6-phosphate isomerase-like protein (cupin superfamily)